MKKYVAIIFLLIIFINLNVWAGWSDYKEASLANLIFCEKEMTASTCVPISENKFIIKGTYTGIFKKIDWKKYSSVLICVNIFNVNKPFKEMLGLYGHELQIKNGTETYWMPVQSSIIPYLKKEVKEGEVINLYVIRLGADKCKWAFFINEFSQGSEKLE